MCLSIPAALEKLLSLTMLQVFQQQTSLELLERRKCLLTESGLSEFGMGMKSVLLVRRILDCTY